ncbi:aldehyde dehydrogenase family protein [Azospirillum sp.]|uniref:aldehyde dehydrogenase family protein n=1 Tax=Azospirillum sp. TaxID=34012 RepID=UPI002623781F|nr:aldehyde dehydrogenase family protein [Azospirillum sp.]
MEQPHSTGADPRFTDMHDAFHAANLAAWANPHPSARERQDALRTLGRAIGDRTDDLLAAIERDFGRRQKTESLFAEIHVTVESFRHAAKHVAAWMRPRPRRVGLEMGFGKAWVQPQPLGVVGVVAPWNYPLFLALGPVAGAIAAGNRVLVKPSELTAHTSALIAEIIASAVPSDQVRVIQGDAEISSAFCALPFNHLIFTGSERIGKLVMKAAAENLTPVTLELGGKSPAIVLPDADLTKAGQDIAFGKFINAGQTCVAPDYVLVQEAQLEELLQRIKAATATYFSDADGQPALTAVFGANGRARQETLIAEARARGTRIEPLTAHPMPDLSFAPSAVVNPPADLRLVHEEIFGPILPILTYRAVEDAYAYVRTRPRPLALYVFGRAPTLIDRAVRTIAAGGMVINDTLVHVGIEDLPFGGVGASGMGCYHGRDGFDRFSHLKAVFHRGSPRLDHLIRPPLRAWQERIARFLINR